MADFRVWGRFEQLASDQFYVVVSAVPEQPGGAVTVRSALAVSRDDANMVKARLMVELGAQVRARADE